MVNNEIQPFKRQVSWKPFKPLTLQNTIFLTFKNDIRIVKLLECIRERGVSCIYKCMKDQVQVYFYLLL